MSDFDEFDFALDSSMVKELDIIEASTQSGRSQPAKVLASTPVKTNIASKASKLTAPSNSEVINIDSDDYNVTLNFDEADLEQLDSIELAAKSAPGPSKTRQTTLTGGFLDENRANRNMNFNRTASGASKTKIWDHSAFEETDWLDVIKPKGKGKGKGKEKAKDADHSEEEEVLYDDEFGARSPSAFKLDFLNRLVSSPPPPMKLRPDLFAAQNWIFPLNKARRDYQFNIARKCLFNNTLVALPTGLGKTFIAGVVMLNYFKWYPEGKIVFVAPTKPLVAQQIEACHEFCGIPGNVAVELTGDIMPGKRREQWNNKRVFYLTPQTLRNDLIQGLVDPADIVLLVIDEAHKGTGEYAYAQVVRFLMGKNPHFRILALSATPGNNEEAVQAIVDSLHISHIEIRNEKSVDLKQYIFEKKIEKTVIKMSGDIETLKNLLVAAIKPHLDKVVSKGIVYPQQNPVKLKPYSVTMGYSKIAERPDRRELTWAFNELRTLAALSRGMGYLLEYSTSMAYSFFSDALNKGSAEEIDVSTSPKRKQNKPPSEAQIKKKAAEERKAHQLRDALQRDKNFLKFMGEFERQKKEKFQRHPKMEKIMAIVSSHLKNEAQQGTEGGGTRIMVFAHYRQVVEELVELFDTERPVIRATRFVGQSNDKQGKKGIKQKEQLEVIQKFKKGIFNVLVSTSIGEEGLDIGEIDRIICYDAQTSSVRMLQRIGRTGRRRQGYVDVLLAEEREDLNWDKSMLNYEDVQRSIINGDDLKLYADVERLLPDNVEPKCLQIPMEIVPYERLPESRVRSPTKKTKTKGTKKDVTSGIAIGTSSGFVKATSLGKKQTKSKRRKPLKAGSSDSDSDDDLFDADIRGPANTPTKRKKMTKTKGKGSDSRDSGSKQTNLDFLLAAIKRPCTTSEDDEDDYNFLQRGSVTSESKAVDISDTSPLRESKEDHEQSSSKKTRSRKTLIPTSSANLTMVKNHSEKRSLKRSWLLEESGSDDDPTPDSPFPSPSSKKLMRPSGVETVPNGSSFSFGSSFGSGSSRIPDPLVSKTTQRQAHSEHSTQLPDPTFAVRKLTMRKKKSVIIVTEDLFSESEEQQSNARLRRRRPTPADPSSSGESEETGKGAKRKRKRMRLGPHRNEALDTEAIHSGDDTSEGVSDVDMKETKSDQDFLQELPPTQATQSYNQDAAYRFSLLSQVPPGVNAPRFESGPKRIGRFAGGRAIPRKAIFLSSSPGQTSNDYEMDTFVVPDDEEVVYADSSEP